MKSVWNKLLYYINFFTIHFINTYCIALHFETWTFVFAKLQMWQSRFRLRKNRLVNRCFSFDKTEHRPIYWIEILDIFLHIIMVTLVIKHFYWQKSKFWWIYIGRYTYLLEYASKYFQNSNDWRKTASSTFQRRDGTSFGQENFRRSPEIDSKNHENERFRWIWTFQ